jgi:UDP-2,3-diacylglucosamine hydrolase
MGKQVYFASDFHLGISGKLNSRERERQIVRWLEVIRPNAEAIYLVGDIFDFWFEYQTVVPKGYLRLFGQLARMRDEGIMIYFFTGNHDMWMFDYFEKELGIPIFRKPVVHEYAGKRFFIGHGDGLGPGDIGYKRLKRIFAARWAQWLFARFHPNFGIGLANFWSRRSRKTNKEPGHFLGKEKEWLVAYAERKLSQEHYDYFVFGHRHLPINFTLSNGKTRYINLGDWLTYNSYGVFDGKTLEVRFFENEAGQVFGTDSSD